MQLADPQLQRAVLEITARPAAYLDPGSGSLLLQVIVASLAGMVFVFRKHLSNLVSRVRGKGKEDRQADAQDED